jgi:hypothetical protein
MGVKAVNYSNCNSFSNLKSKPIGVDDRSALSKKFGKWILMGIVMFYCPLQASYEICIFIYCLIKWISYQINNYRCSNDKFIPTSPVIFFMELFKCNVSVPEYRMFKRNIRNTHV